MVTRRNTKQKNIVYQAVWDLMGHVSAEDIYNKVYSVDPNISKATVYRNLNVLCEEGKLRRIEPYSHLAEQRFDITVTPHSHAICVKCGKMIDVQLKGENLLNDKAVPMEDGFKVTDHALMFEGLCKDCRDKYKEN